MVRGRPGWTNAWETRRDEFTWECMVDAVAAADLSWPEFRVWALSMAGVPVAHIAERLHVKKSTVRRYMRSVRAKTWVR